MPRNEQVKGFISNWLGTAWLMSIERDREAGTGQLDRETEELEIERCEEENRAAPEIGLQSEGWD